MKPSLLNPKWVYHNAASHGDPAFFRLRQLQRAQAADDARASKAQPKRRK